MLSNGFKFEATINASVTIVMLVVMVALQKIWKLVEDILG